MKTYTIANYERENIKREIARLQRRAQRYAKRFDAVLSKPYIKEIGVYVADDINHCKRRMGVRPVEVFDLSLDCEIICKDGYTIAAKIEHFEEGNVVYAMGGEVKQAWRTASPRCEHCGGNHGQKVTYIVRSEQGEEKQVGRTCLKDYCGIDPNLLGLLHELREILIACDDEHYDFDSVPALHAYKTVDVLALAICANSLYGYTPSSQSFSNKERVADMVAHRQAPTVSDLAKAERMASEIESMSDDDAAKFLLDNVKTLLKSRYCKPSHFGFLAYAPLAFDRYQAAAAKRQQAKASEHFGEIGQRLTLNVSDMKMLTSWPSDYGFTYMYKIIDDAGHVMIWYASKIMKPASKIKATIKAHTERDGVKQTIVTRCMAVSA